MDSFVYDSAAFRQELADSPHHAGEVEILRSMAQPGMRVIEVGAHTGVTAVALAHQIGAEGHLDAFEPVPEYYGELTENLSRNGVSNVSTYRLALSDRPGRIRFYKHGGASGITPAKDAPMIWVEATTISDFLTGQPVAQLDLVHLDCEGSELLVLEGAKGVLQEQAPAIFCEIHHAYLKELGQSGADLAHFLGDLGYEVEALQVEHADSRSSLEACSHIRAHNPARSQEADLQRRIEDLRARLPAHSVPPGMLIELEELEDQLHRIRDQRRTDEPDSPVEAV